MRNLDTTGEINSVVEDGIQGIRILGNDFDQVRVTTYNQDGESMIAVFRNGSAMAGVKNHDAMNMEKLHFKSNSNESRVVFRLVDAALAAEGLEDARRKVTLPHLEHRNG